MIFPIAIDLPPETPRILLITEIKDIKPAKKPRKTDPPKADPPVNKDSGQPPGSGLGGGRMPDRLPAETK